MVSWRLGFHVGCLLLWPCLTLPRPPPPTQWCCPGWATVGLTPLTMQTLSRGNTAINVVHYYHLYFTGYNLLLQCCLLFSMILVEVLNHTAHTANVLFFSRWHLHCACLRVCEHCLSSLTLLSLKRSESYVWRQETHHMRRTFQTSIFFSIHVKETFQ